MDDTHTVLKKIHSQEFTDQLNSVDNDIKCMTEGNVVMIAILEARNIGEEEMSVKVETSLAFVDTWTVVESGGSFSMKVSRKDNHTNQYLNFSSNHPLEHKRGVMRTLMNRVDRLVSDETELGRDKEHKRKALQVNGYPNWTLADSGMADQLDAGQEEGEEEKNVVEQAVLTTTMYEWPRRNSQNVALCPRDRGTVEEDVLDVGADHNKITKLINIFSVSFYVIYIIKKCFILKFVHLLLKHKIF